MPLWLGQQPLVLASKSDIRGKILAAAGLRFGIRPAQIDERAVEADAKVSDALAAARLLARAKAMAVAAQMPGHVVLGADQTLAHGSARLTKPASREEASSQLRILRGRTHELHSGLAVVRDGEVLFELVDTARLTMRDFSDRFLDDYLDMTGDVALTSVGAYQLEGIGIHLFDRVDGDYFTILGLPLLPLLKFFRDSNMVDG
ncbi:Maf family protein [Undibacter mobilis]|uniref:Nucleoside triphosphate pyrophosphatase n=1 Tax=Undibacter mobilis TaxID=2292256 RepID=A0A371B9J8_9BRAD|nr:Maf family protein [Undibacter mobilis]RDV04051.1 septum formation inhibitor Maf [Undibacter mobilis]